MRLVISLHGAHYFSSWDSKFPIIGLIIPDKEAQNSPSWDSKIPPKGRLKAALRTATRRLRRGRIPARSPRVITGGSRSYATAWGAATEWERRHLGGARNRASSRGLLPRTRGRHPLGCHGYTCLGVGGESLAWRSSLPEACDSPPWRRKKCLGHSRRPSQTLSPSVSDTLADRPRRSRIASVTK